MKSKICLLILAVIILAGAIISCQHVMAVTDATAQILGVTGVIDPNIANAISLTARATSAAAERITPEQEYYIGRAVAANILTSYRIWNGNPALTEYLNLICAAITINSTPPRSDVFKGYSVAILDTSEINAFATPGGHIFLTRGLINAARSEDALAGVIAHEVAHIHLQHGVDAIRNSRTQQAFATGVISATAVLTDADVNELTDMFNESVGEIFQTLVHNGFSRRQEFDADIYAMALMANAGYNPQGLIDMLRNLSAVQVSGTAGFGSTHPTPADRITNAEANAGRFTVVDTTVHREARFAAATRVR